ncbi:transporter [Ganoderma sinense ZZ0214-1]|uniref:Transporter n=1 Tax=Ganoderma sinense ZZ0214-1 TaxID=1077348 RepID=A0A2G8RP21_9APHY|nr:transporter [Ganoderma sinense ZZ0214-1]
MSPKTQKIGETTVSAIGYGAMGISTAYGSVLLVGEQMKVLTSCVLVVGSERSEVFRVTKFGMILGEPLPDGRRVCGDPEEAVKKLDESLAKLGVDHVDLWCLHRADKTVPIERTVAAMAEQVRAGKVRYLGLSEVSADTLRRAHAAHPIAALQVEYSAFTLDIEDNKTGLLKTPRELGVEIVAYSPVGHGLVTGAINIMENMAAKLSVKEVEEIRTQVVHADSTIGPRYPAALVELLLGDTPPLDQWSSNVRGS